MRSKVKEEEEDYESRVGFAEQRWVSGVQERSDVWLRQGFLFR